MPEGWFFYLKAPSAPNQITFGAHRSPDRVNTTKLPTEQDLALLNPDRERRWRDPGSATGVLPIYGVIAAGEQQHFT